VKYISYLSEKLKNSRGLDKDHILESVHGMKLNDFLIDIVTHSDHMKKHYPGAADGQTDDEFTESLLRALENLFDYIEHLERQGSSSGGSSSRS
jgi:hypothetical protein